MLRQKQFVEARALYEQICALDQSDAEAESALGFVEANLGNFDKAETCFRRACTLAPELPYPQFYLGGVLISQKRLAEAVEPLRACARLKPDFFPGHLTLGNVLYGLGDYSGAAGAYERVTKLKPDQGDAHHGLGRSLLALGGLEEALVSLRTAAQLLPQNVDALCDLARILVLLGKYDEAEKYFRRSAELQPDLPLAIAGLASICERRGEIDRAFAIIQPLIEAGVRHGAVAQLFARVCRRLGRCAQAVDYFETTIEHSIGLGNVADLEIGKLQVGLGRLYDSLDQYDRAFACAEKGNKRLAHLRMQDWDRGEIEVLLQELQRAFSSETFPTLARSACRTTRPIFIVGMPRSGTTLVEQILASHPMIHGAGELSAIDRMAKSLSARPRQSPYPQCVTTLSSDDLTSLARPHLDTLEAMAAGARHVIDKLPHNFLHLGLIALLFPDARIIHCRRDPLDTCVSIFFADFGARHPYAHDLTELGYYYRWYERLMQHWHDVLPSPMFEVQYEDLVRNLEQNVRDLLDFLGLPWDASCLEFHRNQRTVATASYDQVRRPIHANSVGRWRHYREHLSPLRTALEMTVNGKSD